MDLGGLIGAVLQQGMAGQNPGAARLQQGAQSVGGPGGGLEDLLSQLTGGATAGAVGGGSPDLGAMLGGLLTGGSRAALGGGAVGMLAAVALQALKSGAGAGAAAPVAPPQARELVDADAEALVLRAMISAAKADGRIDAAEQAALMDRLGGDGVDAEEKAFVEAELRTPVDVAGLAAQARNPAQAAQVYAASLLAIRIDTEQERAYLSALADALGLSRAQTDAIHRATGAPEV